MSDDPFGLIGHVIDAQIRVDRVVGEGGFSVVYKGHHLGLDEPIAVKCLKLSSAIDSDLVESFNRRFRDESRISYRLSRGNLDIVRSITSGTTTTPKGILVPYMALEWLEGQSLADELKMRRLKKMNGRPLEQVLAFFDSAANAIAYAHAQGVVHRDVKPGNLFVCKTREGVRLKVLDFGLAKILDDEVLGIKPHQTGAGIFLLSPSYGAPEQFDPMVGKIGPWTDVYALTIVMLEALRDKKVRSSDAPVTSLIQALDPENRPTPRKYGLDVGDAVEAVMARAVAIDPGARPKDVGVLWKLLHDAMHKDGMVALTRTAETSVPTMVGARKAMTSNTDLASTLRDSRPAFDDAVKLGATLRLAEPIALPSERAASVIVKGPDSTRTTEETGGTGTLVMDRPEALRRPISAAPAPMRASPSEAAIVGNKGMGNEGPGTEAPKSRPPSARPRNAALAKPIAPWLEAGEKSKSPVKRRRFPIVLLVLIVLLAVAAGLYVAAKRGLLHRFV